MKLLTDIVFVNLLQLCDEQNADLKPIEILAARSGDTIKKTISAIQYMTISVRIHCFSSTLVSVRVLAKAVFTFRIFRMENLARIKQQLIISY